VARMRQPRRGVPRVYEARVLGVPDARDVERLSRGVVLEGRRTAPAIVQLLPGRRGDRDATVRITVHEGRNRQIRRMCEAIGHPVAQLRRVAIGPIRDATLKPGQWRELTADEVRRLSRKHTTEGTE